jgi:hypothetical protein
LIVRHQLLEDPRVPCTSKNSAAALLFADQGRLATDDLVVRLRGLLRQRCVAGSDPGLCVASTVSDSITAFAKRCQRQLVTQREARHLAGECGIYLEGLDGTQDGVIGALAAVGLSAEGHDGRVVQLGHWPDDLSGRQPAKMIERRGVMILSEDTGMRVRDGLVDVGKHLRPNFRHRRAVLFVRPLATPNGGPRLWKTIRRN